jgi:uncharacterized protein YjbI with pentapeptide repeats
MSTPEAKDQTAANYSACAIEMLDGVPCGRPIYAAPDGIDVKPVCLMHSLDPAKSIAKFRTEVDRILQSAPNEAASEELAIADFTEFVFPEIAFSNCEFLPACNFINTIFLGDAAFDRAAFNGAADFVHCSFEGRVDFSCARFCQSADFSASRFSDKADFNSVNFSADARFLNSEFQGEVRFDQAAFEQSVDFWHATFQAETWFDEARVRGPLRFQETYFEQQIPDVPSLRFCEVDIENPKQVLFYHTNLSQALFYHTDVSDFVFSLVTWSNRGAATKEAGTDRTGVRNGEPRRQCLFEEKVALSPDTFHRFELSAFENDPNERNYRLIAETYRQLKRNYDAKGDYWTAGHWHYGEMEMRRLHSRWRWKPLRWLSHHFSLVALYKYASAYGESYVMPLLWLAFVLVAFAFLYPVPGLEFNPQAGVAPGWLGYLDWTTFFRSHSAEHPAGFWGMILHSLMTSLSVAGFQRELRFAPSYPWGRMLALLELLLTTTMGGLLLLAIRRQFKRS